MKCEATITLTINDGPEDTIKFRQGRVYDIEREFYDDNKDAFKPLAKIQLEKREVHEVKKEPSVQSKRTIQRLEKTREAEKKAAKKKEKKD